MASIRSAEIAYVLFVVFWVAGSGVFAQVNNSLSLCALQTSCKACLEASSKCAWCSHWEYTNSSVGRPRCNASPTLEAFGCPAGATRVARPEKIDFVRNEEFQDVTTGQTPVQLRPQKVRLQLRPHSTQVVNLRFRPAKNYPIDLYYLMDLTWSMKDDKETIVSLGGKMARTLGTFTSNYRVGFGSYADKPLMPYIFPGHEGNPCQSEHSTCAPLYAYRHHMRLSEHVEEFVTKVNESAVTGNVDNLEGGLDGVVQAIVCADQVGWAHQARKLMLVVTDGFLHFAGDGKLGGAIRRNDLQCHLNAEGEYFMSTTYDYPSLAEVSRLLLEHKVNLIFAVTEDRRGEYERVARILREKARVATLTANSSNILEIVERAYHEIVTKVVLRDNSTGPFSLEYFSKCGLADGPELKTSECEGIREGQVYEFKATFSMGSCPQNRSLWRQKVVIEDALASEASETEIEVELLCGCDCGQQDDTYCNGHGVNNCGLCECDAGWSGETCECRESTGHSVNSQCIGPGDGIACSNRGECICGSCSCDPGYNGRFCECSPCDKVDGLECGGRGTCNCGSCVCGEGWEGNACQCPLGDKLCIAPGSKGVCAGHGYCECGHCRCNVTASDGLHYRGTYCESSAGAGGSGFCVLYAPCVNATENAPQEAVDLCRTNVTVYSTARVSEVDTASDHYCFVRSSTDTTVCTIPYIYDFNEDNTVVLRIGPKNCRTPLPAAIVPGVAFAVVVLLGIAALLVWKCITALQDRREYAKFEEEQRQTVYSMDENPLFRPATTRFRVPSMLKED